MRRLILLTIVLAGPCFGQTVIFEPNDATNVSVYFRAYDKTTGEPNASPVLTDITRYYTISGAAMDAGVALTALAAATTAHTDNYAYHVGLGMIRVDYPDVAFAGGPGDRVYLQLVDGTGEDRFDPPFLIVQLNPPVNVMTLEDDAVSDSADLADAVWDAQTSQHATAGTVGKAIADAKTAAEATQTDWANGGRLDLILDEVSELVSNVIDMFRY